MQVRFLPAAPVLGFVFWRIYVIVEKLMNPINSTPMSDQERKMLQEVIELSRDNNKMLRKIIRAQRWASFWRFFYWAIIISSIVIGYYWAQPYITPFINFFGGQDWARVMNAVHMLPVK